MEKLITVTKAADQLGVTKKTLQDWDKSGKLPALRTAGGHRRYRQSDIEKLQGIERDTLDSNQVAVYARVFLPRPAAEGRPRQAESEAS